MATLDPALFRNYDAAGKQLAQSTVPASPVTSVTDPFGQDTSKVFTSVWPAFTTTELIVLFFSYVFIFIVRNTRIGDVADSSDKSKNRGNGLWRYGWLNHPNLSGLRSVATVLVHLCIPFAAYSMFVLFSPQFAEVFQYTIPKSSGGLAIDLSAAVYSTVILYVLYIMISAESMKSANEEAARSYTIYLFNLLRVLLAGAVLICVAVAYGHLKFAPSIAALTATPPIMSNLLIGLIFAGIAVFSDAVAMTCDFILLSKKK